MDPANLGRGERLHYNAKVRQDLIYWLQHDSVGQRHYQRHMESLRLALNGSLYLGLFDFEAHYAIYDPGAFYTQHVDSFPGAANRIVSVVTYLNKNWSELNGGELVIYTGNAAVPEQRIAPHAGTLVAFLSETMPHAVNTTLQQRISIAGWFSLAKPV